MTDRVPIEAASEQEEAHARGLREGEARGAERLKKEREKRLRLVVRFKAAVGNVRRLEAELIKLGTKITTAADDLRRIRHPEL